MRSIWIIANPDREYHLGEVIKSTCVLNPMVQDAPPEIITSLHVKIKNQPRTLHWYNQVSVARSTDGISGVILGAQIADGEYSMGFIVSDYEFDIELSDGSPTPCTYFRITGTGFLSTQSKTTPGVAQGLAFNESSDSLLTGHRIYAKCLRGEYGNIFTPEA